MEKKQSFAVFENFIRLQAKAFEMKILAFVFFLLSFAGETHFALQFQDEIENWERNNVI